MGILLCAPCTKCNVCGRNSLGSEVVRLADVPQERLT